MLTTQINRDKQTEKETDRQTDTQVERSVTGKTLEVTSSPVHPSLKARPGHFLLELLPLQTFPPYWLKLDPLSTAVYLVVMG